MKKFDFGDGTPSKYYFKEDKDKIPYSQIKLEKIKLDNERNVMWEQNGKKLKRFKEEGTKDPDYLSVVYVFTDTEREKEALVSLEGRAHQILVACSERRLWIKDDEFIIANDTSRVVEGAQKVIGWREGVPDTERGFLKTPIIYNKK